MSENKVSLDEIPQGQKSENLIKKTCKELGLTYRELGERIGYSESAIKNAAVGAVSEPMQFGKFSLKRKISNL